MAGEKSPRVGLRPGFLCGSSVGCGGRFASPPPGPFILTWQHCARSGTAARAVARTTDGGITGEEKGEGLGERHKEAGQELVLGSVVSQSWCFCFSFCPANEGPFRRERKVECY